MMNCDWHAREHIPIYLGKAMQRILRVYDYRIISLFFACVVYACLGSPTPSALGWPEILVAGLLIISVGLGNARDAVLGQGPQLWRRAGQIFFLYGLSVTTLVGVLSGHGAASMMRDIIPFVFLFLPLFLGVLIAKKKENFQVLVTGLVIIGLVFSARSLASEDQDKLLYLENMPSVLFSALLLLGLAFARLMQGITIRNIVIALCFWAAALLPLAAMVAVHQRASLAAAGLYFAILFMFFFIKNPRRASVSALAALLFALGVGISFAGLVAMISDKTAAVGLNMRPQEMAAVWNIVISDPATFLFGIGWGGHFHSPAVGGVNVNFTHNFFSSVLLKMGLCGVVFALAYILGLLQQLSQALMRTPVLGIAIAAPVFIDLTLYASFKSLDFGLMLLMICGSVVYFRNSRTES